MQLRDGDLELVRPDIERGGFRQTLDRGPGKDFLHSLAVLATDFDVVTADPHLRARHQEPQQLAGGIARTPQPQPGQQPGESEVDTAVGVPFRHWQPGQRVPHRGSRRARPGRVEIHRTPHVHVRRVQRDRREAARAEGPDAVLLVHRVLVEARACQRGDTSQCPHAHSRTA